MQGPKLSTTVDWAVEKCRSPWLQAKGGPGLGFPATPFPQCSQALPVDNSPDFRASRVAG